MNKLHTAVMKLARLAVSAAAIVVFPAAASAEPATSETLASMVAEQAFRGTPGFKEQYGRQFVEDALLSLILLVRRPGLPPLCDPSAAKCREVARTALTADVDRIAGALPTKARQAVVASLAQRPPEHLRAALDELRVQSPASRRDMAAAMAASIVRGGVVDILSNEARLVRPKVERATQRLPKLPETIPPRPPGADLPSQVR